MLFSLTRYLYVKDDVLMSLIISVFQKDYNKALFWACELYYSGYETETILIIQSIYTNFFKSNNPKLEKIINRCVDDSDNKLKCICTALKNLTAKPRKFTLLDFMLGNVPQENILQEAAKNETKLIIVVKEDDYLKYSSNVMEKNIRNFNILKNVCKYDTIKNCANIFECGYKELTQETFINNHLNDWLYYTSFCPLWKERIEKYNGFIDTNNCNVEFSNDDDLEEFHNHFNYELDEQSLNVQNKILHNKSIVQLTMNEFYKKYEPDLKIRIIKKNKLYK